MTTIDDLIKEQKTTNLLLKEILKRIDAMRNEQVNSKTLDKTFPIRSIPIKPVGGACGMVDIGFRDPEHEEENYHPFRYYWEKLREWMRKTN